MKIRPFSQGLLCAILFSFLSLFPIDAQSENSISYDSTGVKPTQQSLFNTWQDQEVLNLQLKAPLSTLFAEKNKSEYQPSTLTIHNKSKSAYETPVSVKVRGKFRRRTCGFPPLKIKLQDKEVNGISVGNYRTFKLVTHCSNEILSNEYLLKEHLIYQLYEELSEESFRTQLVKITYVDEDQKMPNVKRYGFLIEDVDELKDRLTADKCDCGFDPARASNTAATARLSLFQLMIGNTDWDFSGPRNFKVLTNRQSQEQIAVPYDFDFTGFVSPPYAYPNPSYSAERLQDRIMLGTEIEATALQNAIELFQEKKARWYQIVEEQVGLSKSNKKEVIRYLDSFFDLLEEPIAWEAEKIIPYK